MILTSDNSSRLDTGFTDWTDLVLAVFLVTILAGTDFIFIYDVVIPGVTNAIPSTNLDTLPDDETNLTS